MYPKPFGLSAAPRAREDGAMHPLPEPLAAHPPLVKTCGHCSHWITPAATASASPRSDAGMAAQGMRPCARSGQSWRYHGAGHRCHLPQEAAR